MSARRGHILALDKQDEHEDSREYEGYIGRGDYDSNDLSGQE